MTFQNPLVLLALLIVPALYWMGRGRRRWLVLAAVTLGMLALARPVIERNERTAQAGSEIVFLVDVSRSMLTPDVKPNRLERAKAIMRSLSSKVHGERIGLVAFAGVPTVRCPLTLDYTEFAQAIEQTAWDASLRGGTRIGNAVHFVAQSVFDDAAGVDRTIVLLSDGGDLPENERPDDLWKKDKIRVIAIGIGDASIGGIVPESPADSRPFLYRGQPVESRLEPGLLQAMATATGGSYGTSDAVDLSRTARMTAVVHFEFRALLVALAAALLLIEMVVRDYRRQAIAMTLIMMLTPSFGQEKEFYDPVANGYEAYSKKDFSTAIAAYTSALQQAPNDATLEFNLACSWYRDGNYRKAHELFLKAAEMTSDKSLQSRALLAAGNSMYRFARVDNPNVQVANLHKAMKLYRQVLDLDSMQLDAAHNTQVILRRLNELMMQARGPQPGRPAVRPSDAPIDVARPLPQSQPAAKSIAQRAAVDKDW